MPENILWWLSLGGWYISLSVHFSRLLPDKMRYIDRIRGTWSNYFSKASSKASAKEILRLMGQKEIYIYIYIYKCKFWLLSKFFILKSKYYFFRRILTVLTCAKDWSISIVLIEGVGKRVWKSGSIKQCYLLPSTRLKSVDLSPKYELKKRDLVPLP